MSLLSLGLTYTIYPLYIYGASGLVYQTAFGVVYETTFLAASLAFTLFHDFAHHLCATLSSCAMRWIVGFKLLPKVG